MFLPHGTHVFTADPMSILRLKNIAIYRSPHQNFMNLLHTTRIGKFIHMHDLPLTTRLY